MKTSVKVLFGLAGALLSSAAYGHISIVSGPGTTDTTQEVAFGVGHGCANNTKDTWRVKVEIPEGVTGVRPMSSDFGPATIVKDGENVKSITWEKPAANVAAGDPNFYKLVARMKLPKAPFNKVYFKVWQTCADPGGANPIEAPWVGLPGADGGVEGDPAPSVLVLPARSPGWNKFTVPAAIADVSVFFKDALIVWKGNAAYSANATTAAQIKTESGVAPLTSLAAGDEIWVKY